MHGPIIGPNSGPICSSVAHHRHQTVHPSLHPPKFSGRLEEIATMFQRFFASQEFKNTGSLARDLLASERTFLAWTRTGLGFIALGVALEKVEAFAAISPTLLHLEDSRTKLAAGVLVGSGSLCVAHGTARYFGVMKQMERGVFRPNVAGITMMATMSIGIAVAGTLLVLKNEDTKKRRKNIDPQSG
ncbi:hypothetical protein PMIN06_002636 [Paraphaeosphaeria minitans]